MKKLLIFSFSILFLFSCKKDNDQTCTLTVASVSGTYKITAVKYKATPTSPEEDYYDFFFPDACERDDNVVFSANGTYVYNDAGTKCSPAGDDTGTWSLSGNTFTLDAGTANVDNFDCLTLNLGESDVFASGDKLILVFTRQ